MKLKKLLLAAIVCGAVTPAIAGPVLTDLTADDYIVFNNLDWAAASPVSSASWFGANTLFQANLHQGWREATDLEWSMRPDWSDFGGKCASKYWNSFFTHCDVGDSVAQHWVAGPENHFDLWYVRAESVSADVPEPGSASLAAVALLSLALLRKKKTS